MCGDTGNFSECGYSSLPESEPAPTYSFAPSVDYDPPKRPALGKPKALAGGEVRVDVTAESGSRIRIGSEGQELLTATATGRPQTLTFKALEGEHVYGVTARDSADNKSGERTFTIVADATPPTLDMADLAEGDAEHAGVRITLSADEPARYVVRVDGGPLQRGKLDTEGLEAWLPIGNGRHEIDVRVRDALGNETVINKVLKVEIPELEPLVTHESAPNVATREFVVSGVPGATGTIEVGELTEKFQLESDTVTVPMDVPDGSYSEAVVQLTDQFGRKGSTTLPKFVVDTVKPRLSLRNRDNDGSFAGKVATLIAAETGVVVLWRLLDDDENVVQKGTYVAEETAKRLVEDVEEGQYVLAVSATDDAGNQISDEFKVKVGADPLTMTDWVILLVCLALLALLARWLWRKRQSIKDWLAKQRHLAEVKQAQRAYDSSLAQHQQALAAHAAMVEQRRRAVADWDKRKSALENMLQEARDFTGSGALVGALKLVKLKKGERIFSATDAQLVEERSRQGIATLVELDNGRAVVTSQRVIFTGGKGRDWALDKLERVDRAASTFLLPVSNRVKRSGVNCSDPERFALHLDLALADLRGNRERVVEQVGQRLYAHAQAMPGDVPPPPSPPVKPALLLADERASAVPGIFGR